MQFKQSTSDWNYGQRVNHPSVILVSKFADSWINHDKVEILFSKPDLCFFFQRIEIQLKKKNLQLNKYKILRFQDSLNRKGDINHEKSLPLLLSLLKHTTT